MSGHQRISATLSAILIVIGIVMVVTAVSGGGGPLSYGVVVGVLFTLAGAARLWLATKGGRR